MQVLCLPCQVLFKCVWSRKREGERERAEADVEEDGKVRRLGSGAREGIEKEKQGA